MEKTMTMLFGHSERNLAFNPWIMGALAALLVAGCGPEEVDNLGQSSDPIYNGTADKGHPAVGRVNGRYCTGTLIGPKTVLTAHHCVDDAPTASFEVGGQTYQGSVALHPNKRKPAIHDLAVIRLSRAVKGVAPRPLCTRPPDQGQPFVMVGFGRNNNAHQDWNTKLWGRNVASYVGAKNFTSASGLDGSKSQACFGDSGGPAIVGGCVAGVFSWVNAWSWVRPACTQSGMHCRVDIDRSWITRAAGDAGVQWMAPLYRYANGGNGDHFYTTNWNELGSGRAGYRYEGIQGYVHTSPGKGRAALHRYANGGNGDHFYTTNWNELGSGGAGYRYEGIAGYVFTNGATGRKQLHRYANSGNGDHFYTTNWNELGSGGGGYRYEGIVGYINAK